MFEQARLIGAPGKTPRGALFERFDPYALCFDEALHVERLSEELLRHDGLIPNRDRFDLVEEMFRAVVKELLFRKLDEAVHENVPHRDKRALELELGAVNRGIFGEHEKVEDERGEAERRRAKSASPTSSRGRESAGFLERGNRTAHPLGFDPAVMMWKGPDDSDSGLLRLTPWRIELAFLMPWEDGWRSRVWKAKSVERSGRLGSSRMMPRTYLVPLSRNRTELPRMVAVDAALRLCGETDGRTGEITWRKKTF